MSVGRIHPDRLNDPHVAICPYCQAHSLPQPSVMAAATAPVTHWQGCINVWPGDDVLDVPRPDWWPPS